MKTICIDFDGVLHDYSKGWQGDDVFDKAVPGASEGLKALKKDGWTIILFTTRQKTQKLVDFLLDNDLEVDYINYNVRNSEGEEVDGGMALLTAAATKNSPTSISGEMNLCLGSGFCCLIRFSVL